MTSDGNHSGFCVDIMYHEGEFPTRALARPGSEIAHQEESTEEEVRRSMCMNVLIKVVSSWCRYI